MSDITYEIGFVGAGKMAGALMGAMLHSGVVDRKNIICSDVNESQLRAVRDKLGVKVTSNNGEVFSQSDIVFLAFKPQNFPEAVEGLAPVVRPSHIIVSIMAGIRINRIREVLPGRIIRVMPNTPCLIGEMAGGFTAAKEAGQDDIAKVCQVMRPAGLMVNVSEEQMDAVVALSGSGPAFVAYLIDSFITAGVKEGLEKETARRLAIKTFSGTAQLLDQWKMSPAELIEMVSSPNGTTVAGREILEASDLSQIISGTISRAAQRSRELGK